MSTAQQRAADLAFLRAIVAETQVGSAKVAMAMALDRLAREPLVDAAPKVSLSPPPPAPAPEPEPFEALEAAENAVRDALDPELLEPGED